MVKVKMIDVDNFITKIKLNMDKELFTKKDLLIGMNIEL
jgi:hypothetical protein